MASRAFDTFVTYKIISQLVTDWEDMPAFEHGIIDKKGKLLRKTSQLKTKEEKEIIPVMDIVVHPSYFPCIAQMAACAQAKTVIFEVCDNYQKQTYRNRARIAHANGELQLNIPIQHSKDGTRQKTAEVAPDNNFPWQAQHWKSLQSAYRTSPFFEFYEDDMAPLFQKRVSSLLEHNLEIYTLLCELLGMDGNFEETHVYQKDLEKKDLQSN